MSRRLNVIYIAGVARSGTSWFGQVFNSCPDVTFRFQPLFSYEFKGRVGEDSTDDEFQQFFRDLEATETPFLTQSDKIETGEYPRFIKNPTCSSLVFKENRYQSILLPMLRRTQNLRVLGLVRHPCAVLNSWRKNAKEFPPGSELAREWRFAACKNKGPEDYFGYFKWKEVANMYLDLQAQFPERFMLVRYEDAVSQPTETFRKLFDFFGVPFGNQTQTFLEESTNKHGESYYGVYKNANVADKWKDELDPYIVEQIRADLAGTRLEQFVADN